jgi:hypothetical protein
VNVLFVNVKVPPFSSVTLKTVRLFPFLATMIPATNPRVRAAVVITVATVLRPVSLFIVLFVSFRARLCPAGSGW